MNLISCDYPRKDDTESSIDGPANPVVFPTWEGIGHRLGWSIDIGDVDLNGYNDIVVGAPGWNGDMGAIDIILNHPTGGLIVGFKITTEWLEEKFAHVAFDPGDEFGYSIVISGGDEDGRPAIFVGAPGKGSDCGSVFKLMGTLASEPDYDPHDFEIEYIHEKPSTYCWGSLAERFGSSMTTTAGHAALLVGAPTHRLIATEAGAVYVMDKFHPEDPIQGPYSISDVTAGREPVRGYQRFGWSMDSTVEIPDLDPEVIAFAIGAVGKNSKPNRRPGKVIAVLFDTSSSSWLDHIVMNDPYSPVRGGMGFDVAFGHLDCYMGNIDLVVTNPYLQREGGEMFVFYDLWVHPPPWPAYSYWVPYIERSPGAFEYGDRFGWSVASGRLNAGTLWDVIVGAPDDALGGDPDNAGIAFYMFGNPDPYFGFSIDGIYSSRPLWTPGGDDRFGFETALGDLNGDTIDDVAIGAPGWDDKGRFAIFLSGARPAGGPLTGLWEGTIDDSRCPPDEPSEISLYLYQDPDFPDELDGWGWLGTHFEIYLNPPDSGYDGCYGMFPSMCDSVMLVLGDSEVVDPATNEFILWVEPAIDIGGIDFRMPLRFTEDAPGRWHGVCETSLAACDYFNIVVDLWIEHTGTSYVTYADVCTEDCT